MQTYIFELDIIGRTPGSAFGRAAVYSAWVWRSLGPAADAAVAAGRAEAEGVEEAGRRVLVMAMRFRLGPVRHEAAIVPQNLGLRAGRAERVAVEDPDRWTRRARI